MIARVWTGATETSNADAYERYCERVALPGYAAVEGNQAVLMLRRQRDDGRSEFTMITLWDSLDSIGAFAGDDPEVAVFYPEDERFLVERDLVVRHYDVYGSRGSVDS
jgi:heme-degrading monooxygenase HmoA